MRPAPFYIHRFIKPFFGRISSHPNDGEYEASDKLVYELYGMTAEEIALLEGKGK